MRIGAYIDSVLFKWKTDYENLYKTDDSQFDNNFYREILELLRNAENRMNDPLYIPNATLNKNIGADEVDFILNKLKNNKAPGIDKIPNEVLKSNAVKNCLLKLYRYYFDTGIFLHVGTRLSSSPYRKVSRKTRGFPLTIGVLTCYQIYTRLIVV